MTIDDNNEQFSFSLANRCSSREALRRQKLAIPIVYESDKQNVCAITFASCFSKNILTCLFAPSDRIDDWTRFQWVVDDEQSHYAFMGFFQCLLQIRKCVEILTLISMPLLRDDFKNS